MSLATEYEFVLPRGYVDGSGTVHRTGTMRLATARDELEPLRDPSVSGPDDPRLTILVLARVVRTLGTLELVTSHEIEGLFTADMAFLQDFYGVINFGSQQEYEALLAEQQDAAPPPVPVRASAPAVAAPVVEEVQEAGHRPAGPVNRRAQIEEIGAVSR
jgi:hypothetical protein